MSNSTLTESLVDVLKGGGSEADRLRLMAIALFGKVRSSGLCVGVNNCGLSSKIARNLSDVWLTSARPVSRVKS